jgi:nucleotide-binding universal stress UspA family protein
MARTPAPPVNPRIRLQEILCPVDLSDVSRHALDHARAFADWYRAGLTVLEVVWAGLPPIAFPGAISGGATGAVLNDEQRAAFMEDLVAFAGGTRNSGERLRIEEGPILPAVLRVVNELPADLIVIGTHGLSGVDRLLLGSVTDKVLRSAPCAVLTIPPRSTAPAGDVSRYSTVLCAVDFSPASLNGLRYALSLAQETAARLLVVHVADRGSEREVRRHDPLATTQDVLAEAVRQLRATIPDDVRDWCTPEEIAIAGRPHEAIVALAESRAADIIVMGVHGRSATNLRLFGSTTNQVIRHASCPVLTVKD